jgi:hypothetical protein
MRRPVFLGVLGAVVCVAFFGWRMTQRLSTETFKDPTAKPPEPAPLCPWREPGMDLKAFFPGATRYVVETRILSGLRLELAQRLGRVPTGDENALRIYPVYRSDSPLGSIMTRRVKGEYGAIELVLATDTNRVVRGLRLQRLREPETIAGALQDTNWLNSFVGKSVEDLRHVGKALPGVAAEAQDSAAAVVEGVRTLMILQAAADEPQARTLAETHHH